MVDVGCRGLSGYINVSDVTGSSHGASGPAWVGSGANSVILAVNGADYGAKGLPAG